MHGLLPERTVLLLGLLDAEVATRTAAQLMTLDAQGEDEIILHLACDRGQLVPALMLAETIELAVSPVVAVGRGGVGEVALAPFAAANRRLASSHTTFRLSEPQVSLCGDAHMVQSRVAELLRHVDRLHSLLAAATGQPKQRIVADMERGLLLAADTARDYGLVDEILSRSE